jgi:hypothetical protein
MRLSIEIEKELALLCNKIGSKGSPASWRRAVDALLQANVIEAPLAKALIEFRDVRNQVFIRGCAGQLGSRFCLARSMMGRSFCAI